LHAIVIQIPPQTQIPSTLTKRIRLETQGQLCCSTSQPYQLIPQVETSDKPRFSIPLNPLQFGPASAPSAVVSLAAVLVISLCDRPCRFLIFWSSTSCSPQSVAMILSAPFILGSFTACPTYFVLRLPWSLLDFGKWEE
jgi:hypothetical protein